MATKTPVRGELSRERILDAAQAVIEQEGDSALTFRRLGAELDADPTAAYRYFRNKDDLLLALGDRLLGEAMASGPATLDPDADWRAILTVTAHSLRDALVRHPRLAGLISVRFTQGEHEAQGIELTLSALTRTGLPIREAVAVQRALADTVLAWSSYSASLLSLPPEAKQRDGAAWTTTYHQLPADEFPAIHAARPYLDEFEDAFDPALSLMLDGIAVRIAAHSSPSTTHPQENTE